MRIPARTPGIAIVTAMLAFTACGDPQQASPSTDGISRATDTSDGPALTTADERPPATSAPSPIESPAQSTAPDSGDNHAAEPSDTSPAVAPPEPSPPEAQPGGRELGATLNRSSDFAENPVPDLLVDDVGRETIDKITHSPTGLSGIAGSKTKTIS